MGNRIKELREGAKLTQKEFCALSGVAYTSYQKIEKGAGNPTLQTLEAIAATFGIRTIDLLLEADLAKLPSERALKLNPLIGKLSNAGFLAVLALARQLALDQNKLGKRRL